MRARNIKPGFYRDADLVDCSIQARYIAPGLWMMADREGRLKDNPKQIKMELCPCDDIDIDAVLTELATALHIIRYEAQGVKVIQIRKFIEHQNPHKNEPASTLPERDRALDTLREDSSNGASTPADSLIPDSLIPDSLNPERKEKEKKKKSGVKKPPPSPRKKYLDSVFLTDLEHQKLQEAIGQKSLDDGIDRLDYSITVKGGKYKDHYKTLLNWHKRGYITGGNNGNGPERSTGPPKPKGATMGHCLNCGKIYLTDALLEGLCLACRNQGEVVHG